MEGWPPGASDEVKAWAGNSTTRYELQDTKGRAGSAAVPGVAFPAELLAAARGFGNKTEYFKAGGGEAKAEKKSRSAQALRTGGAMAARDAPMQGNKEGATSGAHNPP
jgi:hypothetical protein